MPVVNNGPPLVWSIPTSSPADTPVSALWTPASSLGGGASLLSFYGTLEGNSSTDPVTSVLANGQTAPNIAPVYLMPVAKQAIAIGIVCGHNELTTDLIVQLQILTFPGPTPTPTVLTKTIAASTGGPFLVEAAVALAKSTAFAITMTNTNGGDGNKAGVTVLLALQ